MKKYFLTTAVLLAATTGQAEEGISFDTTSAAADTSARIALGSRIGTLGAGPEVSVGFSDFWTIRGAAHWGNYNFDGNTDDIEYDCDINLASGLVTFEWNVFSGGFHIDAGLLFNGNNIDASSKAVNGTVTVNGVNYTADQAGTLNGEIDFDPVAPYIGMGWGNPVDTETTWTFFFNIGVVYQGSPDVTLSSDGMFSSNPTFAQNLKAEEQKLQDELDAFKYYPVVALGLTYKF